MLDINLFMHSRLTSGKAGESIFVEVTHSLEHRICICRADTNAAKFLITSVTSSLLLKLKVSCVFLFFFLLVAQSSPNQTSESEQMF